MNRRFAATGLCVAVLMVGPALVPASSQQSPPQSQQADHPQVTVRPDFGETVGNVSPGVFMQVPISHLAPGASPSRPTIKNPAQGDPQATNRGMQYFNNLNC